MKRQLIAAVWALTLAAAYLAGYAVAPAGSAAAGQAPGAAQPPAAAGRGSTPAGALPPGEYSKIQLSPDQGEPILFAGADLRKAHTELQARAKQGSPAVVPRDLIKSTVT